MGYFKMGETSLPVPSFKLLGTYKRGFRDSFNGLADKLTPSAADGVNLPKANGQFVRVNGKDYIVIDNKAIPVAGEAVEEQVEEQQPTQVQSVPPRGKAGAVPPKVPDPLEAAMPAKTNWFSEEKIKGGIALILLGAGLLSVELFNAAIVAWKLTGYYAVGMILLSLVVGGGFLAMGCKALFDSIKAEMKASLYKEIIEGS